MKKKKKTLKSKIVDCLVQKTNFIKIGKAYALPCNFFSAKWEREGNRFRGMIISLLRTRIVVWGRD